MGDTPLCIEDCSSATITSFLQLPSLSSKRNTSSNVRRHEISCLSLRSSLFSSHSCTYTIYSFFSIKSILLAAENVNIVFNIKVAEKTSRTVLFFVLQQSDDNCLRCAANILLLDTSPKISSFVAPFQSAQPILHSPSTSSCISTRIEV